jgi:hypothetical protein
MPKGGTALTLETHIEPLNDTNWETWSFLMEQYLIINDLWDIVNGTETEPTDTSGKADFTRRQRSARALIALHVSSSQLGAVRRETDPKKIWDELQCLNPPGGLWTRIALRREFTRMRKGPEVPMSKWITSVCNIAQQIKGLKGHVSDEQVIVVLTSSLPDSYAPLVTQLDMMEESAQMLSHVITCLIGEERRQNREKDRTDDPIALLAKGRRRDRSGITCFRCGEKGHFRSGCPKEKGREGRPVPGPGGGQRKAPSGTLY